MATFPTYPATSFQEAVDLTIFTSNQLSQVINEDATTEIETESGTIPSLRKALVDNFYFKDPIPWEQGSAETVFNQLRLFVDQEADTGWYYAPAATESNPITMGTTPQTDSAWVLYQLRTTETPTVAIKWEYIATGGETTLSPPYAFNQGNIFINGVFQTPDKAFSITNNVITLAEPLVAGDDVYTLLGAFSLTVPDTYNNNFLVEKGNFVIGAVVTRAGDLLRYTSEGTTSWCKYLGTLPHTVATADPESDGGIYSDTNTSGLWVVIGEGALINDINQVQQNLDNFQNDLLSDDLTKGASLIGWQRDFALNTVNNIAEYLNSGEITLYEYKNLCVTATVDGVAVLDWSPALTQALKDSATYRKKLRVSGGDYYLSQMPRFTNLDTSGSLTNMSLYSLIGDGKDKTIFWTNSTQSNFLNFYSCKVYLKDFTCQRRGVSLLIESNISLSWLSLGDVTLANGAVRGSFLSNVRIAQSGIGLQIQHAWDCVFDQLVVQDFGTSAYYINQHSSDNSNNLLFIRPHAETCRYAFGDISRAFALRNGSSGSNRNHGITLIEPHFEPVNWRCRVLDLAYPLHFDVINPLFNRNNNDAYSNVLPQVAQVTSSSAAPIVYINDGVNTHIRGGQLAHIGTQSDSVSAIMQFVGIMKGFKYDGYIDTGKATRTSLISGLDITSCTNGMRELDFNGTSINSFTTMSSIGSRLRITPLDNLQKSMDFVGEQYIPEGTTSSAMVMKLYQSNTQDQSTPMTELMQIYSTGYMRIKGYLGTRVTIAAGAIYGFVAGEGVTNRRGKYGIYGLMNDAELVTEFFNVPGLSPKPIITGTSINLSKDIPDATVTNKLCVYQTTTNNQYVTLENRTSSSITVSILFWAS